MASLTLPQIHTLAKQASHSISHTALHCEDGAEVFFLIRAFGISDDGIQVIVFSGGSGSGEM